MLGLTIWQSTINLSKSYQKNESYITLEVKALAQTTGKDPCDILSEWLAEAGSLGNKQRVADIQEAQKFLGCRNKQKRQQR